MKKNELKNCPQWLLDADTENEDVDLDQYGTLIWRSGDFMGGNFRDGDFMGGNFRGGNFRGGDFRGGNFMSGDFMGGNFRDGNFRGGNFRGGNFMSGDFMSGDFMSGNFMGGNFMSGNFMGGEIYRKPISVYGLEWPIIITQVKMQIGCKLYSISDWKKFDNKAIDKMHPKAVEFWEANKSFLLSICDYEAKFLIEREKK